MPPLNTAKSLRIFARLLDYPDAALLQHLLPLREALYREAAVSTVRLAEIDTLFDWMSEQDEIDAQAHYVELFDCGRATALSLFEHVHGDARERGQAMVDLLQTYSQVGLSLRGPELPDYLPTVLEFLSTQPPRQARAYLGEIAHILNALHATLLKRHTPYVVLFAALLELAGEEVRPIQPNPERPLDEQWEEPEPFAACTPHQQVRGPSLQPLHFVRTPHSPLSGATK